MPRHLIENRTTRTPQHGEERDMTTISRQVRRANARADAKVQRSLDKKADRRVRQQERKSRYRTKPKQERKEFPGTPGKPMWRP